MKKTQNLETIDPRQPNNIDTQSSIHGPNIYFEDVTGVILAGGKSVRFGRDKSLEKVNNIPLIERVAGVMQSLFQDVILIANTPDNYTYLNLPIVEDLIKGLGPLGGIFSALTAMRNETGFFVASDMPSLNRELIRHMTEVRDDFDVVVPRISGNMEALHALYSKRCLPAIKKSIDSGQHQIIRFFPEVSVRYIDEDEIRRIDPGLRSFYNVNTPHDLKTSNEVRPR